MVYKKVSFVLTKRNELVFWTETRLASLSSSFSRVKPAGRNLILRHSILRSTLGNCLTIKIMSGVLRLGKNQKILQGYTVFVFW